MQLTSQRVYTEFLIIKFFVGVIVEFFGILIAMKMTCKWLLCLLLFFGLFGCTRGTVLEAKDVQFFKIQELRNGTSTTLHVSGLAFRSAFSVKKIATKREGTAMVLRVHLFLARPGTSGSFQYDLVVPDSVTEVRFGNDNKVILEEEL